jgi:hypothetical protein
MQAYSDPRRESDPHALPDLEVFYHSEKTRHMLCEGYMEWHTQQPSTQVPCDQCPEPGWYWWSCSPGCLPDGDAVGPFDSAESALADARSRYAFDPDTDEEE